MLDIIDIFDMGIRYKNTHSHVHTNNTNTATQAWLAWLLLIDFFFAIFVVVFGEISCKVLGMVVSFQFSCLSMFI